MKRISVLLLIVNLSPIWAQAETGSTAGAPSVVTQQQMEDQTGETDFGLRTRILQKLSTPTLTSVPPSYISALQSYTPTPGDIYEMTVSVFTNEVTKVENIPFQLDSDYCFDLPILGSTSVKGMDLFTLQKTVTNKLKTVLPVSTVDFRLITPALFDVFIYGKVLSPGKLRMNSMFSLLDSIAMSGGLAPSGSYRRIKVTSASGKQSYFDISEYFTSADMSVNPPLKPNDTIQILPADILVTATNSILYPGIYELLKGETIRSLINFGGGIPDIDDFDKASIIRKQGDKTETIIIARNEFDSFELINGDIVTFVPVSIQFDPVIVDGAVFGGSPTMKSTKKYQSLLSALPELEENSPSQRMIIPYKEGLSVLSVLDLAGGPTPLAKLEQAFILHKGSVEKNPVPNLKELWQTKDLQLDIALKPGDKLIIPFEEPLVYVAGEVNDPKAVPFISSFSLLDYIKVAGGFTIEANMKKYYILDLNGTRKEITKDYVVNPGDIIYIDKNFAQLSSQAFKDVLIYTSFVGSLVATASSIMSLAINVRNWQRN